MSQQNKASRRPFLFLMVAFTLLGYVVGRVLVGSPVLRAQVSQLSLLELLALPLFFLLVIGVHEVGHLAGGLSAGMRFLLLIVGPLQLSRGEGGLRLRWLFNPATFGGLAAATPEPLRPLTPQLRRLIIGGPLSSLLFGALGLGLSFFLSGRLGAWAFLLGGFSLLIFIVTSLPIRAGGFMSDGMQLLELWRGGRAVEERQRVTTILGQSYAGLRPRLWDKEVIQQLLAQECREPVRRVVSRLYAFFQALDEGSMKEASLHADWLGENFALFPAGFRQSITLELALFFALYQRDLEVSRQWWAQSHGGVVDEARRSLTEASLAVLSQDQDRARLALQRANQKLPHGIDPGMNLLTRDQLALVTQQLGVQSSMLRGC